MGGHVISLDQPFWAAGSNFLSCNPNANSILAELITPLLMILRRPCCDYQLLLRIVPCCLPKPKMHSAILRQVCAIW